MCSRPGHLAKDCYQRVGAPALQPSGVVHEAPGPIRTSLVLEGTAEGLM